MTILSFQILIIKSIWSKPFQVDIKSVMSVHDTTSVWSQLQKTDSMHRLFWNRGKNILRPKCIQKKIWRTNPSLSCVACFPYSPQFGNIWVAAFAFLVIWWMNVGEVRCFTFTLSSPANAVRTQLTIPTTQATSSCHNNDSLSTQKLSAWLTFLVGGGEGLPNSKPNSLTNSFNYIIY